MEREIKKLRIENQNLSKRLKDAQALLRTAQSEKKRSYEFVNMKDAKFQQAKAQIEILKQQLQERKIDKRDDIMEIEDSQS